MGMVADDEIRVEIKEVERSAERKLPRTLEAEVARTVLLVLP